MLKECRLLLKNKMKAKHSQDIFNLTCTSISILLPNPFAALCCVTWKITSRACGSVMYWAVLAGQRLPFLFLKAFSHHWWLRQKRLHFSHFAEMLITCQYYIASILRIWPSDWFQSPASFSFSTLMLCFLNIFSDYSTLASFQKHECKTW